MQTNAAIVRSGTAYVEELFGRSVPPTGEGISDNKTEFSYSIIINSYSYAIPTPSQ
jgi:hypothetical protein